MNAAPTAIARLASHDAAPSVKPRMALPSGEPGDGPVARTGDALRCLGIVVAYLAGRYGDDRPPASNGD